MKQKLLLFFASMAFVGCVERGRFDNIHVEVNTSLPLGKILFSDSSLFAMAGDFSSQLMVKDDGVLSVELIDSLMLADQAKFNEIFRVPAQNVAFRLDFGAVAPNPNVNTPIPAGTQYKLSLDMVGQERIDSVIFKSGEVLLSIAGAPGSNVDVTILELKHKRTNVPLTFKAGQAIDIDDNYALTPKNSNGARNEITILFSGTITQTPTLDCNFFLFLSDLQYAKGYFGRKQIKAPSITISTTQEFLDFADMIDYIYFKAPTLDFKILNQYDAPMLLSIDTLEISGVKLNLKAKDKLFFVGAKSSAYLSLTNDNTVGGNELSALINKDFRSFKVNVNAIMNPLVAEVAGLASGYVEPKSNTFSVTDSLFGTYAVSIPMDGVMQNIHFEHGLNIDLSGLKSSQATVKQFAFAFSGKNYMPFDIAINAFVRAGDVASGAKIMLFETPILIKASQSVNVVDATPYIIDATNRQLVDIKPDVVDLMLNSKKIYLELNTSTKNATERVNVKIFSPSSIDLAVQVGAKVDFTTGKY